MENQLFLESLDKKTLSIFLLNGIRLQGNFIKIENFENKKFLIIKGLGENSNTLQIINFNQITSIITDAYIANSDHEETKEPESFISYICEKQLKASIFFINGIRLTGVIQKIEKFLDITQLIFQSIDLKSQAINLYNVSSIMFSFKDMLDK